ncbi:MAG: ATP-dependent protease ATPase subunit HslU, partial [Bacteroidota bacterium]
LADLAVNMVKAEQAERVQEPARARAEDRILDLLIPPSPNAKPKRPAIQGPGFVFTPQPDESASGDGEPKTEDELRERTRARFREMLRAGELDEREVEVEVTATKTPTLQMFGPMGLEEMGINLQEMFGNLGGGKRKKRRMKIAEAREVLLQEEAQKLIDHEAATAEAIERVQQSGIVFIDEIDKVAGRGAGTTGSGGGGPDVSREGVQRDLLPIVEGSTVTTKHGLVKTDHILFIASGAFHVSKPSDLIPELQGRFPIRVELATLGEDEFVQILTAPKNALTKQYQALFASDGVTLSFTDDAIREIARTAARVNEEVENIGARRLHTVLTTLLESLLFEMPEGVEEATFSVDGAYVRERLQGIVEDRDLSQYIL